MLVVCCEGETKSDCSSEMYLFLNVKVNVNQIIMIYSSKSKVQVYQTCDIYPFNPKVKEGKLQVICHIFAHQRRGLLDICYLISILLTHSLCLW